MGGQVRKGEKATHVLFYKFDDEQKTAQAQPGTPTTEGQAEKDQTRPPMVRCYAVFNVEQADGLTLDRKPGDEIKQPEWKAHQTAEQVIQESGVHVAHVSGDRAFYNIHTDKVTLPEREQFATVAVHAVGVAGRVSKFVQGGLVRADPWFPKEHSRRTVRLKILHFSRHVVPGGLGRDVLDPRHRPVEADALLARVRLRPLFRQLLRNDPVGPPRETVFHGRQTAHSRALCFPLGPGRGCFHHQVLVKRA